MQPAKKSGEYEERSVEEAQGQRIEGVLCYLFGFISGTVLYVAARDRFVRFHALQSILFNIVVLAAWLVFALIGSVVGFLSLMAAIIFGAVTSLFFIAAAVVWVYLMVAAYAGRYFKLPFIGAIAERYV